MLMYGTPIEPWEDRSPHQGGPSCSQRAEQNECPSCASEEWDRIDYERGRERDVPFIRCWHCGHEWEAA
jgi:DNA-directed RNA polymerase subunit M/transcription elongation factor TFIIS